MKVFQTKMISLCDANLTIILKLFKKSPSVKKSLMYLDEKSNEISGIFGSKINSILQRKGATCKLIGDVELGIEIDPINHTFSGALGLLQVE